MITDITVKSIASIVKVYKYIVINLRYDMRSNWIKVLCK